MPPTLTRSSRPFPSTGNLEPSASSMAYDLMVVKVKGEFVWHKHDDTDDFFHVLKGRLTIRLRDRDVTLGPGEIFVVPKGVEHCPCAEEETHLLLIEPTGTPKHGAMRRRRRHVPSYKVRRDMRLADCHNFHDFRRWRSGGCRGRFSITSTARRTTRPPIAGTRRASRECDLVPNVLRGVGRSTLRDGHGSEARNAVLLLADCVAAIVPSSGRTRGRSRGGKVRNDVRRVVAGHGQPGGAAQEAHTPQVYQFYFHKDRGLNRAMMQRAKEAGVEVMMLTVDSITGGNRERDLRTGFRFRSG